MTKITIIIAAGAAVLSLLAIVLNLVLYRKIKNYLTDIKTDEGFDSNGCIREEIISVVLGSTRIKESFPKPQIIGDVALSSKDISTETFNFIVETVIDDVNRKLSQKQEVPASTNEEAGSKYAEAYDFTTGTFYHINKYPTDDTIYKLDLDETGGEGAFTLYNGSYKKVSECRDFLEGACEISGDGVTVEIISIGKLSLENGKWAIVKPLEVKFV